MGNVKVPVSLPETEGKGQEQRAHSQMTDGIIFLYRCAWNVGSCLVFINLTYIDNCCRSVLAIFLLSRAWQPPCHSALWQLKKAVGGQGAWTCFCNQSQPFNKNDHDGYSLTKLLCIRHLTSITAFNLQTSYASSLHGLFSMLFVCFAQKEASSATEEVKALLTCPWPWILFIDTVLPQHHFLQFLCLLL